MPRRLRATLSMALVSTVMPQRFGCAWLKSDSAGSILVNPFPDTISKWKFHGYRAEVLAVADGVVEYVKDGIPENVPRADGRVVMAVALTNETVSGNWVSLRIADSVYAFYAHLQPGSIRVRVGQRLRRGEVLGLVGNATNAVNPHLHFYIGNANSLNQRRRAARVPSVHSARRRRGPCNTRSTCEPAPRPRSHRAFFVRQNATIGPNQAREPLSRRIIPVGCAQ